MCFLQLIAGQELWDFAPYVETWYEILAAKLFYSAPCCKLPELAEHANSVALKWGTSHMQHNLDSVLLALMENDLHQVIREIQFMNDNGWVSTHLTDMLYHCGHLKIIDKDRVK